MSDSIRFALPFIMTNQSQKEITHNEALTRLDMWLHLHISSADLSVPPSSPSEGDSWIVAAGATGSWESHDAEIAQWLDGQWRFFSPTAGVRAWVADRQVEAVYDDTGWKIGIVQGDKVMIGGQQILGARGAAISDPDGGTTIDTEARAALNAILATMRLHGLIEA